MDMFGIKSKTAKQIASQLNIPYGISSYSDFTIRWGSNLPLKRKTFNSQEAVSTASNKPKTRLLLSGNGIPVPKDSKINFPVVGRPTKHYGGKKFFYCENIYDVRRAERKGAVYFSQFYNKQREYRVHIGSGKVLLFSVKQGDKSKRVWNVRNGFTFRHLARSEWAWANELMDIQRACKNALKLVGLDFGAVDVMVSDTESQPFVISEINTAPGGSPLMVRRYSDYFTKAYKMKLGLLESEKRVETIRSYEASTLASPLIIPQKYVTINWPFKA